MLRKTFPGPCQRNVGTMVILDMSDDLDLLSIVDCEIQKYCYSFVFLSRVKRANG